MNSTLGASAHDSPWPDAVLSPIARARALAAGLAGVVLHEVTIARPVDEVWAFIGDMERSVPAFDGLVESLEITERPDGRLRGVSRSGAGFGHIRLGFDIDVAPGWCWMVSRPRGYVVCMAAAPDPTDPGRTLYAHVEGFARRGAVMRWLVRATRWWSKRHVAHDVDEILRLLGPAETGR